VKPVLLVILLAFASAAACGGGGSTASGPSCPTDQLAVVAAENFWGSIATQIAGGKACVISIISNPNTDPHDYDAKPSDARLVAGARYVIENGAGYDPWLPRLLSANPSSRRRTLDVAELNGVKDGGNPHLWYSPACVNKVIERVTADLKTLDPANASYYDLQGAQYQSARLKDYSDAIAAIKNRYAGTPIGASESVFEYMAAATGLNLITPPGYMKAISEGADPSAADKATVDQQVAGRQMKVFVFNAQNSTPDVKSVADKARAAGIPVVPVTETLSPAGLSFQDWQTKQLKALLRALGG